MYISNTISTLLSQNGLDDLKCLIFDGPQCIMIDLNKNSFIKQITFQPFKVDAKEFRKNRSFRINKKIKFFFWIFDGYLNPGLLDTDTGTLNCNPHSQ